MNLPLLHRYPRLTPERSLVADLKVQTSAGLHPSSRIIALKRHVLDLDVSSNRIFAFLSGPDGVLERIEVRPGLGVQLGAVAGSGRAHDAA
ncbi:hypothetical protein NRB_50100 [Novosphingobium sp. 11B]